ncbi:TPA: hypothetical protein RQJ72_001121 [Vibrio vulnificus]|nr:hypothetical protein [Vibrio vulnificus]
MSLATLKHASLIPVFTRVKEQYFYYFYLDVDFVLLAIIAERSKNGRAIGALERLTEHQKIA